MLEQKDPEREWMLLELHCEKAKMKREDLNLVHLSLTLDPLVPGKRALLNLSYSIFETGRSNFLLGLCVRVSLLSPSIPSRVCSAALSSPLSSSLAKEPFIFLMQFTGEQKLQVSLSR